MNSIDDLTPECLGNAGLVYEHTLVSFFFAVVVEQYSVLSESFVLLSVWSFFWTLFLGRGEVHVHREVWKPSFSHPAGEGTQPTHHHTDQRCHKGWITGGEKRHRRWYAVSAAQVFV